MKRFGLLLSIIIVLALLAGGVWAVTRPERSSDIQASLSAVQAVSGSGDLANYARVTDVRPFVFPTDHGAHPDYRTEWWYYTGNVATVDGRRFGFQLTFFRSALTDQSIQREATLATNQAYMAHFALTDVQGNTFYAYDRFQRGAAGLAGASGEPFSVFLEDWRADGSGPEGMTMHLRAAQSPIAIDLTLDAVKPPTLQGDRGLSQKGSQRGNASYYYSLTRMATDGTITINDQQFAVSGTAWMDHEWGTSALESNAVGWDWFSLQLDDNRDLTYFQIRLADGGIEPLSGGKVTAPDGSTQPLALSDVQLDVLETWTSPIDGSAVYPARWRLRVPSQNLDLTITPQIADQELPLTVRYWEGSVRVEGNATGYGYVELTGYGEAGRGRAE